MDLSADNRAEECSKVAAKAPAPDNEAPREPQRLCDPVTRKIRRTYDNDFIVQMFSPDCTDCPGKDKTYRSPGGISQSGSFKDLSRVNDFVNKGGELRHQHGVQTFLNSKEYSGNLHKPELVGHKMDKFRNICR